MTTMWCEYYYWSLSFLVFVNCHAGAPIVSPQEPPNTHLPPNQQDLTQLIQVGNQRYLFSDQNTKVSWMTAREMCRSKGLHIAVVNSAQENAELQSFVKKNYPRSFWGFWLGATDLNNEGTWIWDATGNQLTYNNWDDDQPGGGNKENCLILHRSDAAWNDFDCSKNFSFICQQIQSGASTVQIQYPVLPSNSVDQPAVSGPKPANNQQLQAGSLELITAGTNQYYFGNRDDKLTWSDAQQFCKNNGLRLAYIESEQENNWIHENVKKLYERKFWGIWIGGYDKSQEGQWLWESSNQPLTYSNWDDEQPGGGTTENCILFHRSDGKWNDFDCQRQFNFICKKTHTIQVGDRIQFKEK